MLLPYLDDLVVRLVALVQRGQKLVQEGALTALASLADAAKSDFAKYYDQARVHRSHCRQTALSMRTAARVYCMLVRLMFNDSGTARSRDEDPVRNGGVGCLQIIPLLRQILGHTGDKAHQTLRAKALECISLVGMAVGRDRFREDAHAVMQYMQTLQVGTSCCSQ